MRPWQTIQNRAFALFFVYLHEKCLPKLTAIIGVVLLQTASELTLDRRANAIFWPNDECEHNYHCALQMYRKRIFGQNILLMGSVIESIIDCGLRRFSNC